MCYFLLFFYIKWTVEKMFHTVMDPLFICLIFLRDDVSDGLFGLFMVY